MEAARTVYTPLQNRAALRAHRPTRCSHAWRSDSYTRDPEDRFTPRERGRRPCFDASLHTPAAHDRTGGPVLNTNLADPSYPTRRSFLADAGALGALVLAGCTAKNERECGSAAAASAGSAAVASTGPATGTPGHDDDGDSSRLGSPGRRALPRLRRREDSTFQSAQELSSALTSGDIDAMAMTDPQVSASLTAGGTPVRLKWIVLGATPEQGRFGIMVGPTRLSRRRKTCAAHPSAWAPTPFPST